MEFQVFYEIDDRRRTSLKAQVDLKQTKLHLKTSIISIANLMLYNQPSHIKFTLLKL